MLNIVLLEPEIPANTGNIGRTCVAAGAKLHLIEPMGFQINEKQVKRAGLDYWDKLDYTIYDSYPDFLEKNPGAKIYMATTKAKHIYSDVSFEEDCYINEETTIRIPMYGEIRSLNLGNSVAIVLYEALRQQGFPKLNPMGHLHHSHWQDGTV